MSRPTRVPPELRGKVFRGTAAVRQGILTPNELRGPAWRRLFKDVYADRDLPVTHALRARAGAAIAVPGSVVTGRSAAVLWGVDLAAADDDVELTLPPTAHGRRIPGIRVRRAELPPALVRRRRGVNVTTPEATALRLAGALTGDEAVIAVDQLVAAGIADLAAVRELAARLRGPGASRARAVCALADGLAESPQETRLRLLMIRGGLPPPISQFSVRAGGRFDARVDFAWPEQKVAVEYDGLWHAEPGQFAKDRQRLNRLMAAGWRVIFVTAADLHRPEALIARIAAALAA